MGGFIFKTCISHLFATINSQFHNLPGDCASELFKPLNDAASLLLWILINWIVLDFGFLVGDVVSGVGFWPFHLALDANR